MTRPAGCGSVWSCRSPTSCGSLGSGRGPAPARTARPCAASTRTHSRAGRVRSTSASSAAVSAARSATRPGVGGPARPAGTRPSARHSCANWASLPAPRTSAVSAQRPGRTGRGWGGRCRSARGRRPPTRALTAWLTSIATAASSSPTSTCSAAGRSADEQAGQRADRGVQARDDVGDGDADLGRLGRAGHGHQAAAGLGHDVVAGLVAVRAVAARPRTDTQTAVRGRPAAPPGPGAAGGGAGSSPPRRRRSSASRATTARPPAVVRSSGDRAPVAVDREEVGRVVAVERRPPAPGVVAQPGSLDLEHVGPEVGEHHAAVRAGEHPGQVEHPDPGQRPGRRRRVRRPAGPGLQRLGQPGRRRGLGGIGSGNGHGPTFSQVSSTA